MRLKVIVGTFSDNAWYVAKAVEAALASQTEHTELVMASAQTLAEVLEVPQDMRVLICTSTHGSGDVPENLQPLYADLGTRPRYLGGLRYGVIALGDSFYGDTFAMGGKQFDARLADLGATRIGEPLILDASDGQDAEALAAQWALQWWQLVQQDAG
ncbi:hypothetical protein AAV94_11540 [Lampropedia cohaerens]|uniref:Flavodoxin-like domain-containing protein n=1 Tax=Lampropedia cohaerens TaxID=1610491 RepID=A0A0U1PYJ7_9BURK|nr:flavodoxin domain-containing protein [Lampropedia cohaerens]KKW67445.1 hypothetical protein AAV94_11540 [Lampropedia cohaerens]